MLENDLSPQMGDPTVYLKDYQPPLFAIPKTMLDFQLQQDTSVVVAELHITRNGDHAKSLVLNGEKLKLVTVKLDGEMLSESDFQVDEQSLTLHTVPDKFKLTITTELQPHLNSELSGLYRSSGNFCTQCEAEGFRRITYFLDRPDVLSEYEVTITADKASCPILLSNGNPVARGDNSDGTHWHRWHDPYPKPSYLFAIVAGDLERISDKFVTASGAEIALHIYAQKHNIDKCDHAMQSLKNSMLWDEQIYGREYDLEVYNIVAVDDFNMGAMENKGLNIFNSKYVLADQQTATDRDFRDIESVIGHEYFHNWSGNRVTCRDWFQLSLKEGLTVFRDQEFSADMGSRAVKRINDVQVLRSYQFKEDAGPLAHPVRPDSYQEINNFYTVTIYQKGAELIRMLRTLVGEQGFRSGTDRYFDRYDGQAVTTEEFVQSMEKANNIELNQFRLWYTQSGTPKVEVEQSYDEGRGVLTLNMTQSCPATPGQVDKQPFQIPITLALFDKAGNKLESKTAVLNQAAQSFDFGDLVRRPVVSILRDFSAPILLEFKQSDADLAHLVQYDDNGYVSWESMQQLSLNLMLPVIAAGDTAAPIEFDEAAYQTLSNTLQALLNRQVADQEVLAEMLKLPVTSYLAELCKPINPQRIVAVKEVLGKRLAIDLEPQLIALYDSSSKPAQTEFSLSSVAIAERAIKNTALNMLTLTDKPEHYQLARQQYDSANNMTDRLAAFAALVHGDYAGKDKVIADFYTQWQHDTLVLDKWFSLQALIPQSDALERVHQLAEHAAFSIRNPNKVRSLFGAFSANMRGFHRQDGAAYQLLADNIIKLNAINPQVAARLTSVFNNWRAFATPYAELMRDQLQRVKQTPDLSKDISEIVNKALQDTEPS